MSSSWTLSGNSLATSRYDHGGCGVQTAALVFGGENSGGSFLSSTEEYNGTTWSAGGAMPEIRAYIAGFGVDSAAVAAGGFSSVRLSSTKEYNGTTWSAGGALSQAKTRSVFAGVLSAGLFAGGYNGTIDVLTTEEYNGTTWSIGGNLLKIRKAPGSCGTQTDALTFGTYDVPISDGDALADSTERYNGTAWSVEGNLNSGRGLLGGFGDANSAIACGGNDYAQYVATTEMYNGTAWSTLNNMNVARGYLSTAGSSTSGLSAGGKNDSGVLGTTEEFIYTAPTLSRHRGNTSSGCVLFNGSQYVGDYANGKIYKLDMNTYTDDGTAIRRTRRTQIISKERNNVIHNKVEVDFEHGVGLDVAEGVSGKDPQATLKWSDDEGNTWSDGMSVDIGAYQQYGTRAIWRRLGKSRNRIYELTIEEPVKVVITGSYTDLKACRF